MKNKFFIFILAATGVLVLSAIFLPKSSFFNKPTNTTVSPTPTQTLENYQAKVIISAPGENLFIEYETHTKRVHQPFSVLKEALEQNDIPFEVETYDFGVFVKSIADLESTSKKAWIYFVNGESGQVAADKMNLEKGDLVEWKYITPTE